MNKSQDSAFRINWFAREAAASRVKAPQVPRPRTEEDALSDAAMQRIKWSVRAANRRVH